MCSTVVVRGSYFLTMRITTFLFVAFLILSSCRCEGDITCDFPIAFNLHVTEKSSGKDVFFELGHDVQELVIVSRNLDTLNITKTDHRLPPSLVVYLLDNETNYTLYFGDKTYPLSVKLKKSKVECCFKDRISVEELHFANEIVEQHENRYYRIELQNL